MREFQKFPSIPRLRRDCVITEKIDGTNGCIVVDDGLLAHWETGSPLGPGIAVSLSDDTPSLLVSAQSRNGWVKPGKQTDNHGFAAWVWENATELAKILGTGYHYGEWWGSGIQRGYGLPSGEKRFSLFNTGRWTEHADHSLRLFNGVVPGLYVVPTLYTGIFTDHAVNTAADLLRDFGSYASPGFKPAEGLIVYHKAAGTSFKYTLDGDGHKGVQ